MVMHSGMALQRGMSVATVAMVVPCSSILQFANL
jgi:hypothetical protein